jgi:hypothetical protein
MNFSEECGGVDTVPDVCSEYLACERKKNASNATSAGADDSDRVIHIKILTDFYGEFRATTQIAHRPKLPSLVRGAGSRVGTEDPSSAARYVCNLAHVYFVRCLVNTRKMDQQCGTRL